MAGQFGDVRQVPVSVSGVTSVVRQNGPFRMAAELGKLLVEGDGISRLSTDGGQKIRVSLDCNFLVEQSFDFTVTC